MTKDKLVPPAPEEPSSNKRGGKLNPIAGEVSKVIGSGENAQDSIVYKTITWSFLGGAVFSTMIFIFVTYKDGRVPLDEMKSIWSIFIPVITLSLGYIFGKKS